MRWSPTYKEYRTHNGLDLAGSMGTTVKAASEGTVIKSTFHGTSTTGLGNYVEVSHSFAGRPYTTLYAHLTSRSVSVGAKVKQGDLIGYVGSTGGSTGPHLHYEIKSSGNYVDPAPLTGNWRKQSIRWTYRYLDNSTHKGWKYDKELWHYFDTTSIMKTGWTAVSGKSFYLDPANGDMQIGWKQVNGKWYYLSETKGPALGSMQTGWLKHGGHDYYLAGVGAMVTGTQVINGKTYTFNSSGQLIK